MPDLSKLRICFLAGTLDRGGAERQLFYILKALGSAGADVTMLTLTRGEYWESRIAGLGVPIDFLGTVSSRAVRALQISNRVRRLRPHVVHSQHFYTNLYAVLAARCAKAREVGSLRNDVVHEVAAHHRWLGRASLKYPRLLAANSRRGVENATRLGVSSSRVFYLPNAIDTDEYLNARPTADRAEICYVGRLTTQKRVDVLLQALQRLRRDECPAWHATIVGDGPERLPLEQLARKLKLFPGLVDFVGAADPKQYYERADLVALTSDWEGTPNVILEAMASALPVVATAVGGVPELVQHGETGLLAPAGDTQLLSRHLAVLCKNVDTRRRMGAAARRDVAEHYSLKRLACCLEELYAIALA
jgi:glycosyltransferase involved in cell wall biosynthesis